MIHLLCSVANQDGPKPEDLPARLPQIDDMSEEDRLSCPVPVCTLAPSQQYQQDWHAQSLLDAAQAVLTAPAHRINGAVVVHPKDMYNQDAEQTAAAAAASAVKAHAAQESAAAAAAKAAEEAAAAAAAQADAQQRIKERQLVQARAEALQHKRRAEALQKAKARQAQVDMLANSQRDMFQNTMQRLQELNLRTNAKKAEQPADEKASKQGKRVQSKAPAGYVQPSAFSNEVPPWHRFQIGSCIANTHR